MSLRKYSVFLCVKKKTLSTSLDLNTSYFTILHIEYWDEIQYTLFPVHPRIMIILGYTVVFEFCATVLKATEFGLLEKQGMFLCTKMQCILEV